MASGLRRKGDFDLGLNLWMFAFEFEVWKGDVVQGDFREVTCFSLLLKNLNYSKSKSKSRTNFHSKFLNQNSESKTRSNSLYD